MSNLALQNGLPSNLDAERVILGSILMDYNSYRDTLSLIPAEEFSLEAHRRIFGAMQRIDLRGGSVDRVTIAEALMGASHLESVGGLTYLISLDDGLPALPSIEPHISIVREKAALRKIVYASQSLIERCLSPGENAPEIIATGERMLDAIGRDRRTETAELLTPLEIVEKAGGIQNFLNPKQGAGVKTPWQRLTNMTNGYRRGELFIVAGNPSMGKSAAALQVAMDAAEAGNGVLIFSLEMSRQSLVQRMACCRARVDGSKLRSGYLNSDERARLRQAIAEFGKWPLWIAEHGVSTVSGIRSAVRRQKAKRDIFMLVIDYLQLLRAVGKFSNRNAEVSEITRGIKLLAVDEDVNVQLLSQLNRDNMRDKRPPALHDLRESGSIEQDADAVVFVWRPEMLHRDREDLRGHAELILAKQRNGPVGKVEVVWLSGLTKFESRSEDIPDEPPQYWHEARA
jgi:replicative DNA helicase